MAYNIYANIPYSEGLKRGISCSGNHNSGNNSMRVCIKKTDNEEPPYIDGYRALLEKAGEKPMSKIAANRPERFPPCTKRIIKLTRCAS